MVILFIFSYKVVVGLVDPVGNTVELHDLKPYTYYQLDLRDRNGQKLYASVNFSSKVNLGMLKDLLVCGFCSIAKELSFTWLKMGSVYLLEISEQFIFEDLAGYIGSKSLRM